MKLIKLLSAVIVLLVIGNVTMANRGLDQSLEMANLQQEIIKLTHENSILQANLASASSLAALETRIEEAGFRSPTRILAVGQAASALASR